MKILMNPTMEMVDGGKGRVSSKQRVPIGKATASSTQSDHYKDIINYFEFTPHVLDDGGIKLLTEGTFNTQVSRQPPVFDTFKFSYSGVVVHPDMSLIISTTQKTDGKTEDSEESQAKMLFIFTPTIVGTAAEQKRQVDVQVEDENAGAEEPPEESTASTVPGVTMLAKNPQASAEDKAHINVDCVVLEFPHPLIMDEEIASILNPVSPPDYGLQMSFIGHSAWDKQTPRQRRKILIEKLMSGGGRILARPILKGAEGQPHKFETAGSFVRVTPHIVKDGSIVMQLQAEITSKFRQDHRKQNPIVTRRTSSFTVHASSGESVIIGGAVRTEEGGEGENNATKSEEKTVDMVFFITPTIVDAGEEVENETAKAYLQKEELPAEGARSVKAGCFVLEIPYYPESDKDIADEARTIVGDKVSVPPVGIGPVTYAARLLKGAIEIIRPSESFPAADDIVVTQEELEALIRMLAARGYVRILYEPAVLVADGQTAELKTDRESFQVTTHIRNDGNLILQMHVTLRSELAPKGGEQMPIIGVHDFSNTVRLKPGTAAIIGGTSLPRNIVRPDNAKRATETLCIVTAAMGDRSSEQDSENSVNDETNQEQEKQKIEGETQKQFRERMETERLRQQNTSNAKILVKMQILTADDKFLEDIGLDANSVHTSGMWSEHLLADSAAEPNSTPYPLILDDLTVSFLLRAVQAHKGAKVLSAPQVVALNGKQATIKIVKEEYYFLSPSDPNDPSGKTKPKRETTEVGTSIKLTPNLIADNDNVRLDFEWEQRQIVGFGQHTGPDNKKQRIPVIDTYCMTTIAAIPKGKTLLVGRKITEEAEIESKTPLLGDLPLVGGFFRNYAKIRDQKTWLILVKPTVNPPISNPLTPPPLDLDDPLAKKLQAKFERDEKERGRN